MATRKKLEHRVKQRRTDAAERQAVYDESTTQTKIENCYTRRGLSKKELHRLQHGAPA